ncbi:hypothetical protein JCM8547_004908 [Rhodosporidiobolus lusitaniae]
MFGRIHNSSQPHGLLFYVDGQPRPLPLLSVNARASIVDLAAQVQLTQTYRNDSTALVAAASYVFPVPDRGAVCGFAMVKEEGARIVGVVEEKEEARKVYEEAVEAGKLASLSEQATPDIAFLFFLLAGISTDPSSSSAAFKLRVGNILPGETVRIELTLVTELTEGDTSDSIRFHLPARVGQRYGGPPAGLFGAPPAGSIPPPSSSTSFDLHVDIEAASPLTKISCPSHTVSTELEPDPSLSIVSSSLPSSHHARVSFTSAATLERDFVLELSSPGLDSPRCLAESHPSSDSVAVSLTLVPRFKLPEVENQEFIFLVDRSGSMSGDRIDMARKALVVLLRSLPHKGTTFNIVSFGSEHEALWKEGSQSYNQETLDEATRLVDSLEANHGGTEMRNALQGTFDLRKKDRPTSVFILTDGDAWDLENVNNVVKTAVAWSTPSAPLRVFVLGIGNSASTAMCEGIARHGSGIAQFVVDGEKMTGKCARLLKAAKTPTLLNARLDFGEEKEQEEEFEDVEKEEGEEKAKEVKTVEEGTVEQTAKKLESVNLFDVDVDPLADESSYSVPPPDPVNLPPPAPIQQAPHKIRNLFPGTRLHAYAILSPSSSVPSTVTLRGELASGQQLSLDIPVTSSTLPPASTSSVPPPIHTLAARKLIQDLEDGQHSLPTFNAGVPSRTVKAAVVRLGKTYSLASTHTSFIAVDELELDKPRKKIERPPSPPPPTLFGGAPRQHMRMARAAAPSAAYGAPAPGPAPRMSLFAAPAPGSAAAPAASFAAFGAVPPPPPSGRGGTLFGAALPHPPPCPAPAPVSAGLFGNSTGSSFGGGASGGGGLFGSAATPSQSGGLFASSPSALEKKKQVGVGGGLFGSSSSSSPSTTTTTKEPADPSSLSSSNRLDALARLQSFDGSFSPLAIDLCLLSPEQKERIRNLSRELEDSMQGKEEREKVVATLVVLAFWEREMSEEREEWEEMGEKARAFVGLAMGRTEEEVLVLVKRFV